MNPPTLRRLLPLLLVVLSLLVVRTTAAQPSNEDWIATVIERAEPDDPEPLRDCLRQKLAGGVARNQALVDCMLAITRLDPLRGLDELSTLQQVADEMAERVGTSLVRQGMPASEAQGKLGALRDCMRAWALVGGTDELPSGPELASSVSEWCFQDLGITMYRPAAVPKVELQMPVIGSPGCPGRVEAGAAFTCTPTGVERVADNATWTWMTNSAAALTSSERTITLTALPGEQLFVGLRICNPGGISTAPLCVDASQDLRTNASPGVTLSCDPVTGNPGLSVSCTASLTDATDATTKTWSAPGGSPTSGSGEQFTTRYTVDGDFTITFTACNGTACTPRTQSVRVDAIQSPTIETVGCTPASPAAGAAITCTPRITGPVTATTWSAPGGQPAAGTGPMFSTSFAMPGAQQVTLRACNRDACTDRSQPIPVGATTFTANGTFGLSQSGCGSHTPYSSGTMRITIDPTAGTVSGTMQGGGGGSREMRCGDTSGQLRYSFTYTVNFTGTVNRTTGAISATGTLTGTTTWSYSGCQRNGESISCSSPVSGTDRYTEPVTLTGTADLTAGTARGTFVVPQAPLPTEGDWHAGR